MRALHMPRCGPALNSRVPFVALVFPVAAVSAGDSCKTSDDFDSPDPFCALVAKLRRYAQPHGRTVIGIEGRVVESQCEQRLRMASLMEIQAFVVEVARTVVVHAAKNDVASVVTEANHIEQPSERHTAPLSNCAPAFDAFVARDLRLLRHALQLRKRKGGNALDGALDDQTIRSEVTCNEIRVARVRRRGESIHSKMAIDVVIAIFPSKAARSDQKVVEAFSRGEDAPNAAVIVEYRTDRPATGQRRRSRGEKKPALHCGWYQPLIIDRIWLTTPCVATWNVWMIKKPTSNPIPTKCHSRAN